jgi:hypothetical protein
MSTSLGFIVGEAGLDEWPTLRAFLLDLLGKIDPEIAAEGIKRSEAQVEKDCAARPNDCKNLDAYADSPTCAALFGPDVCDAFRKGQGELAYLPWVLGAMAFTLLLVRRDQLFQTS